VVSARRVGVAFTGHFAPILTRSGIGRGAPVKNDRCVSDAVSHSGTVGDSDTSETSKKLRQGLG
jgi:hypothetical protein